MDQPTFTPVQQIVERSGTLFFSFQELDSTKPSGSVKIRIETIAYYLERRSPKLLSRRRRPCLGRILCSRKATGLQKRALAWPTSRAEASVFALVPSVASAGPASEDQYAAGAESEQRRHNLINTHSAEHDVRLFAQWLQKKTSGSIPRQDG